MEIINAAFRLRSAVCVTSALLLGSTNIFARDVVLNKLQSQAAQGTAVHSANAAAQERASFGLISYSVNKPQARALYVSSGGDLSQAGNMLDDQTTTAYIFSADDKSPTTVIDLGRASTLQRLSAVYSPRAGKMEFYFLQGMPNASVEGTPETVRLDEETLATMRVIGSANDDGSLGRASVEFPPTAGRYVMVRWTPATEQDTAFTLAEITAVNEAGQRHVMLAANENVGGYGEDDGKTLMDGKTMLDAKDIPAEGPIDSPAEGPPPSLPQPPPFTFVPILLPISD